jgi:arylsulfatase A-like enzyme
MNTARFCRSVLLVPLLLGLCPTLIGSARAEAPPRPNVLVIFIDDFGYGDANCYGGAKVPTPSIDRLASEGMRFTQFYTASPICSASRCGLLTGQFPARWRITSFLQTKAGNRVCEQVDYLDPAAPNYVRALQQAGYATAHVGKWHLGGGRDVTDAPKFAAYGYQSGWGTYESPEPAAPLGLKTTPWEQKTEAQQVPRHDRTRWMVDQTLTFARAQGDKPWLVNLWLDDVHTPYRPSAEQQSRTLGEIGTPEYRAVLGETDRQIGRLLAGLDELKLQGRTLVILAGDNGPEPSFNRARTAGLRGMKWSLYEGGIRTPCIIRWPGVVPAGRVNEQTVLSAVDLYPTLCGLLQLQPPAGQRFDGEDMSAALKGDQPRRQGLLLWEYGRKPAAMNGPRAFPYPSEPGAKSPNVALRSGDWKLLINADGSGAELYDLARDPTESINLAADRSEIAQVLSAQALAWRRSLPRPE